MKPAWHVKPLRLFGNAGEFLLNVKISRDLGYSWSSSIQFAWSIWGYQ